MRGVGCPVEFYGLTRVKRKFSPVHTDCRQDQVGLPEFCVRRTSEFLHPRLIFLPTILNRSNSIDILGNNVTFLRIHVSPLGRRRHYACQHVVREQWCELSSEISSILWKHDRDLTVFHYLETWFVQLYCVVQLRKIVYFREIQSRKRPKVWN